MSRRVNEFAQEVLPPDAYLSDEWHEARQTTVSASEIAAVLGLSPYTSPFDLWWTKRSGEQSESENRAMRRGRRLEGLIVEDFTDAHPEFHVQPAGLCVSDERPWQACTPDGLAYELGSPAYVSGDAEPLAVVEAKTDGDASSWGAEGTDDIPVHYRCQVLWQMDCLGLPVAYVPMWLGVSYREYVVAYDTDDVKLMRQAALDFLDSVEVGRQPDVDAHRATARRLRRLHPDLVDDEVVVSKTLAAAYTAAVKADRRAKARRALVENRLRNALGRARWAVGPDGTKVATRSVFDVPERTQTVTAHTVNKLIPPRAKSSAKTVREATK